MSKSQVSFFVHVFTWLVVVKAFTLSKKISVYVFSKSKKSKNTNVVFKNEKYVD